MAALPGVTGARLNIATGKLTVEGAADLAAIRREGAAERYVVVPEGEPPPAADSDGTAWERRRVALALVGVLAGYAGDLLGASSAFVTAAFVAAAAVGGWANYRKAVRSIPRRDLNMAVLMSAAVIGAVLIGEYAEAGVVALLFALSEMLEGWTMDRARRSIRELMDIAPRTARVEREGGLAEVPVDEVRVGEVVHVRPGEKLAVDGVVIAGASTIDQAAVTGESIPVEKGVDDEVWAGTLNVHGLLRVRVTKNADDTTIAKIIHMVEEAQAHRAPSQAWVERFAAVYTPIVIGLAAAIALLPPLLTGQPWQPWIYRGLALLVVSCPCALVVSTPVAIVSAISNAARRGVLVKGGVYLEQMGSIAAVAFDKTGTLTEGTPAVTRVTALDRGIDRDRVLAEAAAVETHSEHPLARAIVEAAGGRGLSIPEAHDFSASFGLGAGAIVGGRPLRIGSLRLFPEAGEDVKRAAQAVEDGGETALLLGDADGPYGLIAVADRVRPDAAAVVARLKAAGMEHVAILTGDNERVAAAVARQVGADRYEAGLLPADKLAAVRRLLDDYGAVAMIGDGVNDAPALATATVGIAMGGAGSDTALETADIALLSDDLAQLPFTVGLARATLTTIRRNIGFALGVKLLAVAAVFPGWLTLWLAILADMGASVLVTVYGMRLLRAEGGQGRRA